ncbi:rhombosortase [Acinetobacter stercoris]|uniref:Rhomboid family protein n=1 Tax=Acinetobacter stercoris TaxID=2126983 RepID=A0A2U3MUT8_9GAMM|nr:rhombosortase [Acinetobacter stercoris]SPL69113.1 Rhomboid family protein [Acinetobacter stercoris]
MQVNELRSKIVLIAVCCSFSACLQVFPGFFIYLRANLFSEFWRLWTAHWVHVGWVHYLLNMLAFACLPFIFPQIKNKIFVTSLFVLSPLISLVFYFLYPAIEAYAGLSGVLHGLYVFAAILYLTIPTERKFALLILTLVMVKLLWENTFGQTGTAELIGSPVLVEAHLWGAICSTILALLYLLFKHKCLKIDG